MSEAAINWRRVVEVWRASGRTQATVAMYRYWAGRFVDHCLARGMPLGVHLRRCEVERVVAAQGWGSDRSPISAARALSCALAALDHPVPAWEGTPPVRRLMPVVQEFVEHRRRHRGVAPSTVPRDVAHASLFLRFLRGRGRRVSAMRVVDVDAFVVKCAAKWAPKTVAGVCSSVRAFLRFLHFSGRVSFDLASSMMVPRVRTFDCPPRALPWKDVRRIMRAIDLTRRPGCRDFAAFLMMAAYGMGAAEVTGLTLDDVDWTARTIRVRRPKTGNETVLPLLDPVGRALARYLRKERPAHSCDRTVFVSHRLPHRRVSSSTFRFALRKWASRAGIHAPVLGTHVLRHTHATRQIEAGVPAKLVGDILGHRRPDSTSVYVRNALQGLRAIALPVPT
jgi:integrase/recombinase XerD